MLPTAISIAGVQRLFDAEGRPTDEGTEKALRDLASALGDFLATYVCPRIALEAMVRDGDAPGWVTRV